MTEGHYEPEDEEADDANYCIDCGCHLSVYDSLQFGGRCIVCDRMDCQEC